MGFLSRKNKSAPAPAPVEDDHPIVEELRQMEDAVPETPQAETSWDESPRPAGPVVDEGSSSSQAAGDDPSSTPPTGEEPVSEAPARVATAPSVVVEAERDEAPVEDPGPERFMPRDLIAPSRHEAVVEEPVVEVPT